MPLDSGSCRPRARSGPRPSRTSAARFPRRSSTPPDSPRIIFGTRGFGMIARYTERYERHRDVMTARSSIRSRRPRKRTCKRWRAPNACGRTTGIRVRALPLVPRVHHHPGRRAPPFRLESTPSRRGRGRKVERYYDIFLTAYAFSVTGLPAMSIPCGFTSAGLPVGLQVVGPRLREDLLLRFRGLIRRRPPRTPSDPRISISPWRDPSRTHSQAPVSIVR